MREIKWRDTERHVVIDRAKDVLRANNAAAVRRHVAIDPAADSGDSAIDFNIAAARIAKEWIRGMARTEIIRPISRIVTVDQGGVAQTVKRPDALNGGFKRRDRSRDLLDVPGNLRPWD